MGLFGPDSGQGGGSFSDILALLGATLKDAGNAYGGRQSNSLQTLVDQQQQARTYAQLQQAVLGQPSAVGTPGVNITPNQITGVGGMNVPPVAAGLPQGGFLNSSEAAQLAPILSAFQGTPQGQQLGTQLLMQIAMKNLVPQQPTIAHQGDVGYTRGPNGDFTQAFSVPAAPDYGEKSYGINPQGAQDTFIIEKKTGQPKWLGIAPPPNVEIVNGQAVDKSTLKPGTVIPRQEQIFSPAEIANKAALAKAEAEARGGAQADKYDKPILAEADDGQGNRAQVLAQQDKNTGQWVTADEKRTPLANVILPGGIPGGGRAAAQISRVVTAAKDVATGLNNVANLPVSATTSIFGGSGQTLSLIGAGKQYLGNKLSAQEIQDANASFVGIGKALGTLDAGGLQTSDTFMKQLDKLQLAPGDTNFTKMRKLAEMRQMADNSLESQLAGPLLSPDQKKYAQKLRADLESAIPWMPNDVTKLEQAKNPQASLRDYAKGVGLGPQSTARSAPEGVDPALWQHMTPQEQALWK